MAFVQPQITPEQAQMMLAQMQAQEEAQRAEQQRFAQIEVDNRNLAEMLDRTTLEMIGQRCKDGYQVDLDTQGEWNRRAEDFISLAKQEKKEKVFPWPGASNVKWPLLTVSSLQFAARAGGVFMQGADVVKGKVVGRDPDGQKRQKAERVAGAMSFQVREEMTGWEDDTDRMLHSLPIIGQGFRKTYFDIVGQVPVTRYLPGTKVIVNQGAPSVERAPRISECFELYPREIEERIRAGLFIEFDYAGYGKKENNDDQAPVEFVEQHTYYDLDEDGYAEPVVVTYCKDNGKVVKITMRYSVEDVVTGPEGEVVRINPIHYYTPYQFFPDPEGGLYGIGYGHLLEPINETINTLINQLIDAGTLANTQGGFIGSGTGTALEAGALSFAPGEWKQVNTSGATLRDNLVPAPFSEPSPTLFNLLTGLLDAAKEIGSINNTLLGDVAQNASPTTVMAMIEQGMKVNNSIFARLHRSFKDELGKLFRLNGLYLIQEKYSEILDDEQADVRMDFDDGGFDVVPVSNPNETTYVQKLASAEFLKQFIGDPFFNQMEIRQRMLQAANVADLENLLQEPPAPQPGTDDVAKLEDLALKKQKLDQEYEIKRRELEIEEQKLAAENQLSAGEMALKAAKLRQDDERQYRADVQRGMGDMAQPPANGAVFPMAPGPAVPMG